MGRRRTITERLGGAVALGITALSVLAWLGIGLALTSGVSTAVEPVTPTEDSPSHLAHAGLFAPSAGPSVTRIGSLDAIAWSVEVADEPTGMVLDPVSGNLCVPAAYFGQLSIVSPVSRSVVGTVTLPNGSLYAADDPVNGLVAVTGFPGADVAFATAGSAFLEFNLPVSSMPGGPPAFDPVNNVFYVPVGSNLTPIEDTPPNILANIPVGIGPHNPMFDPLNGEIYSPNQYTNNVSVISTLSNRVVATVPVGADPYGATLDPVTGDLYVDDISSGAVSVISGSTNAVLGTIGVGSGPYPPIYDPDNRDLYVPNSASANISVISTITDRVVANIPVGPRPTLGTYDSANQELYVQDPEGYNVSVISTVTNTLLGVIPVGGFPQQVIYDPATGEVYAVARPGIFTPGILQAIAGGFDVTFSQSGLPAGSAWSVTMDGTTTNSTGPSIVFQVPGGTHSYQVNPVPGFSRSVEAGSLVTTSGRYQIPVAFAPQTFAVVAQEAGLPLGTTWSATVNGVSKSGTGTSIAFALPDGTYPYNFSSVPGYTLTGGSGSLVVTEAAVSIGATYSSVPIPRTYAVTAEEAGLPLGTMWSATVNGVSKSGSGTSIEFDLPNGTFAYSFSSVAGYTLTGGTGSVVVAGGAAAIGGSYSAISAATPPSTQVSVVGYSNGFTIAVAVAATALGFAVATLLLTRRSKAPSPQPPVRGPPEGGAGMESSPPH
ncbi:MAG TPA: YncE family protein [Thermoplasmata archaeon]|nr:YncE family protein [Thermoplasmata archaeon]